MKYWDASALVPLLVWEPASAMLQELLASDRTVIATWQSSVECAASLARLERHRTLTPRAAADAFGRLAALREAICEIRPSEQLRRDAVQFLRLHDIRMTAALELGAAHLAANADPATLEFVCMDDRLRVAAQREGFRVLPG